MNKLVFSIVRMTLTEGETEVLGEKLVPVPLFPPQILHGLAWHQDQTSKVTAQCLTTSAMAKPNMHY
jgi:hypothetical protein